MELRHTKKVLKPIGKLEGINLAIEDMSPKDLNAYDILESKTVKLEFEGGIIVEGEIVTGSQKLQGEITLIRFKIVL
jgi:phenylalanine-4-hydroxylase